MFNIESIPSKHYDLTASLKIMNNNEPVVRELADMLYKNLPEFKHQLHTAFSENNIAVIQALAHKLHGGICYVISPRLESLLSQLQSACKQSPEQIPLISPHIIPSIDALETTLRDTFKLLS